MTKQDSIAMPAEKALVEACLRNERQAQEQLYRKYFPAMMRLCKRHTNDREAMLEIINNGFLRVFQNLKKFEFKGSLEGWIRKIVYHALADYYQRQNRYLQSVSFEEHDAEVEEKATSEIGFQEILRLVDQLPAATREVFCLYAIDGYKHHEIATHLNISDGTSKWHLASARTRLKDLLNAQKKIELRYGTL